MESMRSALPAFVVVVLLGIALGGGVPPAAAETMGFNLSTGTSNDAVCRFKPNPAPPGVTETRYCSVVQTILDEDYEAPGRLEAPFNGTVVGWSVVAGPRSSNTGKIGLALRTGKRGGPVYQGADVLLPEASPGSRVHFSENLPIEEGAQIALRIGITTRGNAEEAGAPLAFATPGIARTETFLRNDTEPWGPGDLVETTEHQGLLLEAEIVSTDDTTAPIARRRFSARQDLGRGATVQVRSSERGAARAKATLRIAGLARSFHLLSKRINLPANTWKPLRLRLGGPARRAVATADAEGRGIALKGIVRVLDVAGNQRSLRFQVKGR